MGPSYSCYPGTLRGDPKSAQLHRKETFRNVCEFRIRPSRHLLERAKRGLISYNKADKTDKIKCMSDQSTCLQGASVSVDLCASGT